MRDVISDTGAAVVGGADPVQALNDAAATINTVIGAYGNALERLLGAGAKTLLVPNLPDLGAIPETAAQGPEAQFLASTLTGLWNAGIAEMTAGLSLLHGDADILLLDVNTLFNQILVDPDGFGFSNVTDGCILLPDPPDTCDGFAFWDVIHPTTQAHALVGQAAAELLEARAVPAPAALVLMLAGIAGVVAVRRRRKVARLTAG